MNILSIIVLLSAVIPVLGAAVQFPSAARSKSPDGKWQVECKSEEANAESVHSLLLKRVGGTSVELRRFDRHCDTLWSPDSSHLAVTDWLGSNMSDVFVYSVSNSASVKSLSDAFPTNAIPSVELRGHCYFEAIKWVDRFHLRFRVFGHTDEVRGRIFDHKYIFDIRSAKMAAFPPTTP